MLESNVPLHYEYSLISEEDVYLFNEGSHFRLFEKMGAHPLIIDGRQGVYFGMEWESSSVAIQK
jgi:1,4-alpha-glucan branching enzyme